MTPTWQTDDGRVKLYLGDCLEVLRGLPSDSVDSVVTDPPYGLTTNKKGGTGVASVNLESPYGRARISTGNGSGGFMGMKWDSDVPAVEVWAECLRVLKPGGCLLSFAGTRTQHRMAVRIEDAGFEIRDMIAWVYGSGFPKSHNGPWGGTALKPALEPITVARKPLTGTVAENVLRWGTGGLNVDGCRVAGVRPDTTRGAGGQNGRYGPLGSQGQIIDDGRGRWPANLIHDGSEEVVGLFPQAVGSKPGTRYNGPKFDGDVYNASATPQVEFGYGDSGSAARFFYCAKASKSDRDEGLDGFPEKVDETHNHGMGMERWPDGSLRERVTPPASRRNHHPTVKPTDLMRYLCRLVTPAGGVVLDPFTGSGSTGRGAVLEGFRFIGMEREAEYLEIATRRILASIKAEKESRPKPERQKNLFAEVPA